MPASRVPNRNDWIVNIVIVALAVGGLCVAGLLLGRTHPVVFIGAALVVVFLLVRWNAGATAYVCANCGQEFTLTPLQDFLGPHTPGTKYARCPHCGQRSWRIRAGFGSSQPIAPCSTRRESGKRSRRTSAGGQR